MNNDNNNKTTSGGNKNQNEMDTTQQQEKQTKDEEKGDDMNTTAATRTNSTSPPTDNTTPPTSKAQQAVPNTTTSSTTTPQNQRPTTLLHRILNNKNIEPSSRISLCRDILQAEPTSASALHCHRSLPLHVAVRNNARMDTDTKLSVVRALIEAYPEALVTGDANDCTPLHLACAKWRSARDIKILLDWEPGAAFIKDNQGNMPLHTACSQRCSLDKFVVLYQANPDAILEVNKKGMNVLALTLAWHTASPLTSGGGVLVAIIREKMEERRRLRQDSGLSPIASQQPASSSKEPVVVDLLDSDGEGTASASEQDVEMLTSSPADNQQRLSTTQAALLQNRLMETTANGTILPIPQIIPIQPSNFSRFIINPSTSTSTVAAALQQQQMQQLLETHRQEQEMNRLNEEQKQQLLETHRHEREMTRLNEEHNQTFDDVLAECKRSNLLLQEKKKENQVLLNEIQNFQKELEDEEEESESESEEEDLTELEQQLEQLTAEYDDIKLTHSKEKEELKKQHDVELSVLVRNHINSLATEWRSHWETMDKVKKLTNDQVQGKKKQRYSLCCNHEKDIQKILEDIQGMNRKMDHCRLGRGPALWPPKKEQEWRKEMDELTRKQEFIDGGEIQKLETKIQSLEKRNQAKQEELEQMDIMHWEKVYDESCENGSGKQKKAKGDVAAYHMIDSLKADKERLWNQIDLEKERIRNHIRDQKEREDRRRRQEAVALALAAKSAVTQIDTTHTETVSESVVVEDEGVMFIDI